MGGNELINKNDGVRTYPPAVLILIFGQNIDRGVKEYLRKMMDKGRSWMGQGNGL